MLEKYNWVKIDWSNIPDTIISRPTENQAFSNLSKFSHFIRTYGLKPKFTEFEQRILRLDLKIQLEVIPVSESQLKLGLKVRKPIVIYEIANITNHTAEFIQKSFDRIQHKLELMEYLYND